MFLFHGNKLYNKYKKIINKQKQKIIYNDNQITNEKP